MVRRPGLVLLVAAVASAPPALASCVLVQDLGSTGGGDAVDGDVVDGGASDGASGGEDGTDAARPADGAGGGSKDGGATLDPTKGPGPLGALPGGYCCTSDSECRQRHCRSVGGGQKMCMDECTPQTQAVCDRPGIDFRCVTYTAEFDSACEPPPGFTCLDPQTFVRGTLPTGACCTDEGNGLNGHECESNLCISRSGGPLLCWRICQSETDCPDGYGCYEAYFNKYCAPTSASYTCN